MLVNKSKKFFVFSFIFVMLLSLSFVNGEVAKADSGKTIKSSATIHHGVLTEGIFKFGIWTFQKSATLIMLLLIFAGKEGTGTPIRQAPIPKHGHVRMKKE